MGLLRLILALAVVETHTAKLLAFPMLPGSIAVQGFYIISGFYMSLILSEKYLHKEHAYKLFITNRILRIYPLYLIVLVLSLLFFAATLAAGQNNPLSQCIVFLKHTPWWMGLFLFFISIFILGQDILYFMVHKVGDVLLVPQSWTLSLEFMFYLLAPFIIRLKSIHLVILLLSSLSLRLFLFNNGLNHDPWTNRFFPTEMAFFLVGIFSFKLYQFIQNKRIPSLWNAMILASILMMTVLLTVIKFYPLCKALVYFMSLGLGIPFIFYLTKNNKFDRWIGEFSYPIYISHFLVKMAVCSYHISGKTDPRLGLWVVAGSFLLSYLMLNLVIYPIDKFREKRVLDHKL